MPLTRVFIENDGALGEGAGVVEVVLVVTEYIEVGWIVSASRPLPRLVERGTGSNRVVEDEAEDVSGGVTVNEREDAGLSVE